MIKEAIINTVEFFLLPLFVIYLFNIVFDFLIKKSVFSPFYLILIAPGIVVHEISHSIAALLMGSQIKHVNLFSKNGGHVIHTQPKIPFIGQFIISFAPIIGQIFAILIIGRWASPKLFSMSWHTFSVNDIGRVFQNINWSNPATWILMYVIISCCLAIAPSKKDLNNAFMGIVATTMIIFLLFYSQVIFDLKPYLTMIMPALWLAVLLISIITLILLPFVALNKLLGKW